MKLRMFLVPISLAMIVTFIYNRLAHPEIGYFYTFQACYWEFVGGFIVFIWSRKDSDEQTD